MFNLSIKKISKFLLLGMVTIIIALYIVRCTTVLDNMHYALFNPFERYKPNPETSYTNPNHIVLCDSLRQKVENNKNLKCLPKNADGRLRILVLYTDGYLGESNFCLALAKVLDNKSFDWAVVSNKRFRLLKNRHVPVIDYLNPDIVLYINTDNLIYKGPKNYGFLHLGQKFYEEAHKSHKQNLMGMDGFLLVGGNYENLIQSFEKGGKKFPTENFVFSLPKTDFENLKYDRLFYCGANWDKLRSSPKYKQVFKMLEDRGYLDLYGPEKAWKGYKAYRGFLPVDQKALTNAIQKNGITLILHSDVHLRDDVPTGRIFEAVSASSVVICDQLPFAKKHFGDSFLYIDTNQPTIDMFKQIDQHVKWIRQNPNLARQKARKAHQIFLEKFTLEIQLDKIMNFHSLVSKTGA